MGPALAIASGERDRVDHVIDGWIDSHQCPVAEDPDASRTHLDVGGPDAESDRAHDVEGVRIDPQEGVVVAIADPDRAVADGRPGWSPSDGDLADDRVRSRIDDRDGLACELHRYARAARRLANGSYHSGRDHEPERGGERESLARRESSPLLHDLGPLFVSGAQRVRARCLERRVMAQDRALQLLQTRAGLDPELLAECPPRAPVRLERLCLTTTPVESEHQLGAQALPVGMRRNERLELGDERVLASQDEVGFDPGLERCQSELLETGDLGLSEGLEGEVCECGSPPEREGIPKRQRSTFGLTARELPPTALQQRLEAACIEPFRPYAQHVARGLREQELFAGSLDKESPQPREVDVQDRVDRLWGSIPPELLDESLARDRLIRMDEKEAEERALLRTPEREPLLAPEDFKRPKDAKLEIQLPLRASMVRRRSANGSVPGPFARCIRVV
jgi:hypothetical protein